MQNRHHFMRKLSKDSIRKKLQKKVEDLWKTYCKKRDKTCRLCGGTNVLQVHHIFPRGKKRIFIDVDNGMTLCKDCHCFVSNQRTIGDEIVRRQVDPAIYDRLYEEASFIGPFLMWKDIVWLEEQIQILEELIEELP